MRRRLNFWLWAGFLLVLAGLLSYVPIFSLFPITRDFPWVNLLLFLVGGILLGKGLRLAFRQPALYRGKVLGPVLAALSVLGVSFFIYGLLLVGRRLPPSAGAPRVGQKAPDFALLDQNGERATLRQLLSSPAPDTFGAPPNGALLIFYRGHW